MVVAEPIPITGTVLLNDKPVEGVFVFFILIKQILKLALLAQVTLLAIVLAKKLKSENTTLADYQKGRFDSLERLFHNMRASRQIELTDEFPTHVVAAWLVNSLAVAERHYLKTTENHIQKAIAGPTSSSKKDADCSTDSVTIEDFVAPPVSLHRNEPESLELTEHYEDKELSAEDADFALCCTSVSLPPAGFEPALPD